MQITMRHYDKEQDYWDIRQFLREVSLLNDRHDYAWTVLRLDYWRWHVNENIFHLQLGDVITLWEAEGRIAAVITHDGPGEVFFQIHPDFAGEGLFPEMLDEAWNRLSVVREDGVRELIAWVNEGDAPAKEVLAGCGYLRSRFKAEYMRRCDLTLPIPEAQPAEGYSVRALGDVDEHPARSWVSWKAFHPDEPDEKYQGWHWYANVQRAPLYRRDLDIVAVSAQGEIAAFCTAWFDDVTRTVIFEPVGTHPDHQRRGLGKAVMAEGLRRAQLLGATLAKVSSYSEGAHALYASMGFTEFDLLEPWIREEK